jgi:hypothetical protein
MRSAAFCATVVWLVSRLPWFLLLFVGACETDAGTPSTAKPEEPRTVKAAGVFPDKFECSSIMSTAALTEVLGGPTRAIDSPSSVPPGLARPCTYEVAKDPPEYWTFDFDCRDGYKKRADALFAQYQQINDDRIQEYNRVSDAGIPKAPKEAKDAAVVLVQPGASMQVDVGAKALDHNDQGLLFIDDDAPCYVRVIGPAADRRLALAKQVAKQLTFMNAPMTPRPAPK